MPVTISPSRTGIEAAALLDTHLTRSSTGTDVTGEWRGRAAARLGLSGRADPDQIRGLLSGKSPVAAGARMPWIAGRGVAAWLLTIEAPRSVATCAHDGPDDDLAITHDRAVDIALTRAEEVARSGYDALLTRSLVAVGFPHRYDWAMVPALEQRVLLLNITCAPERPMLCELDYAVPYEVRRAVETAYDEELRKSLATLGYGVRRRGVTSVEIEGVASGDNLAGLGLSSDMLLESVGPETSPAEIAAAARRRRGADAR